MKPIDIQDVQDTYRLRLLLEPEAAVLASQCASAAELDRLDELSAATVAPDADQTDRNEANRPLHVAIVEAECVPLMTPMTNSLYHEVERFLNRTGALW